MTLKTDTSLKLWLPMNEGSGTTVYDYSGNSNNGSMSNVVWNKAKDGKGTNYFNGSNSGITFSSNPTLHSSFSVCFWAKNGSENGFIFAKDDGSINDDIQYRITVWNYATPKFHFELGNTANTQFRASTRDVSLNVWYFVSTTFDSSTGVMNIYLDGIYSGTATFTGTRVTASTAAFIGRRNNGVYYTGYLKNFMLFERVLTANEINDLMKQTYVE